MSEFKCMFPKCRDGLWNLLECNGESVFLVIVLHELKGIVIQIAKEANAWFHTPNLGKKNSF